jgi:ribosomal protein S18 acetylase RimI-like enzyme
MIASFADGGLVRHADGVALIDTGLPMRLFNQIIVESSDASIDALSAAIAIARERADRFAVTLRAGTDDRFKKLIADLGLAPMSAEPWMPGMILAPIPTDAAPSPAGYEIVQATDENALEDHIRASNAGTGMREDWLRALFKPDVLNADGVSIYTGYVDGKGVTTGVGFRTGRTIGVYNISTTPEARRRGYGEAMTRRIAQDGAVAGCDLSVLQASPMGLPIYQRMGYRTVVEYMAYIEPDATS